MNLQMHNLKSKKERELFPLTLEEFEKLNGSHTFSDAYQKKKNALLAAVDSRHALHRSYAAPRSRRHLAAAVCAALILLPATVYAAGQIYNLTITKKNYQAQIHIKKDCDSASARKDIPVKLSASYLPKGSEPLKNAPGKYQVPSDNGTDAHSVSLSLLKLDVDDWAFESTFTVDYEEFSAKDNQAFLIQKAASDEKSFDKEIYVIFENYGYMATAYLGTGISNDEAKKIADGLTLIETDEEHATKAPSLKQWLAEKSGKEADSGDAAQSPDTNISLYQIGDVITDGWGHEIVISGVQVMDNIRELAPSNFQADTQERLSEIADPSGNLKKRERKIVQHGDGITSLDEVKETESVKQKFVYLTLELTNTNVSPSAELGDEICTLYSINYYKEGASGVEPLDSSADDEALLGTEPVYFDGSVTENTDSHFFWARPEKGETLTCHLGYLIDEDRLPYLYVNTSFDGLEKELVDIRQN